jgi:hypothetical protein
MAPGALHEVQPPSAHLAGAGGGIQRQRVMCIYAFGYDSDRGAGSYALDDLSVTTTSLNAGS